MDTQIIKISACSNESEGETIFGLGMNQKIYYWSHAEECWKLYSTKKN